MIFNIEGKKQNPQITIIDFTNVQPIKSIKKEFIYLFYSRYLENYQSNYEKCLESFINEGGKKEDFEMLPEVERALIASFRRQLKRQYKVDLINEMLDKKAFKKINTVILQKTIKDIFKNGIDKDFITSKLKQYSEIYEKPRRNEVLEIIYTNDKTEQIIELFKLNVYMPLDEIEKIFYEVKSKIDKNKDYFQEIIEDYKKYNPNDKTVVK